MLPAAPGFARKVKPLVRLGERELAAYCVLTGIDYIVEECPMAAGNRHLGYKEALNAIEERSPGSKASFLFGFLDRAHEHFAGRRGAKNATSSARAAQCGAPTPGDLCAFCRLRARATGEPIPCRTGVSRSVRAGDRVLLVDNKQRRHLITLAAGGQFHTHAGIVDHDALIGRDEGTTVRTAKGARLVAVRPTLAEYVLEMPRGAQVIYPKDLGPILMLADIFPGARVLESGDRFGRAHVGAAARDRAGTGRVTGYELRDDFADRAVQQRARVPRRGRAARRARPRRLRRHRRARRSIASCSTSPNRGAS